MKNKLFEDDFQAMGVSGEGIIKKLTFSLEFGIKFSYFFNSKD